MDEALAIASHLPHMVASALATATPSEMLQFVGKGWMDSTRIAASNTQLWRQILEENHAPALQAMKNFATICETWIEALERADFDQIESLLKSEKQHVRLWQVDIYPADGQPDALGHTAATAVKELGIADNISIDAAYGFLIQGRLESTQAHTIANELLSIGSLSDASRPSLEAMS